MIKQKKLWSLSTTVRNPERILPFLEILKQMEGKIFDEEAQIAYQTLLIQHRLYRPNNLPQELSDYYEAPEDKMDFSQAQKIFNFMRENSKELQRDPGLRGRTSVAPLTKMGLAFAKKSLGEVKITSLGDAFLSRKIDIGELFFRFFLKWQIPNPDTKDYKSEDGYDIKPFVGVMKLINLVNNLCTKNKISPKGLSKEEFGLFCPTLVNFHDISNYAKEIIALRQNTAGKKPNKQRAIFNEYKKTFLKNFLKTDNNQLIKKYISNLKDYGDNAIRYFRLTRYFYIRGSGFYIDLEPRRSIETQKILSKISPRAHTFKNSFAYLTYLSDINRPVLPWETKQSLVEIANKLTSEIIKYESKLKLNKLETEDYKKLSVEKLKSHIIKLRKYRTELQQKENHYLSQKVYTIEKYVSILKNIHSETNKALLLEKYTTLGLNAINDAEQIKPNYPVGDDNEPTFTAPANVPDIECYYDTFNAICEVTMLTTRNQWYNEGQPVMRHLREFENKSNVDTYCLFIAPRIHRDTINTFWTSVKYEYEGKKQFIIPLSINQFVDLLNFQKQLKEKNIFLSHLNWKKLLHKIVLLTHISKNSSDWLRKIPKEIDKWKQEILT
jgi:hypothetical protein